MTEKQEILTVQTTSGFSFHVSIESEIRVETSAKYPDKNVVKLALGGHTEKFDDAKANLEEAITVIRGLLKKPEGDEKNAKPEGGKTRQQGPTATTA